MTTFNITGEGNGEAGTRGEKLASRMMYLAWKASKVVGLGALQDRGHQPEEEVWFGRLRPGGIVSADYVFGRMMKLRFVFGDHFVAQEPQEYREDYQSFAKVYPNFESLVRAAAADLKFQVEYVLSETRP